MSTNAAQALSILMERGDIAPVAMTPQTLVMLPPRAGAFSYDGAVLWSPWADAPTTYPDCAVPPAGPFDTVILFAEKDHAATTAYLAQAVLSATSRVIIAADNDAGGKRLPGLCREYGLVVDTHSKNHARIVTCDIPAQNIARDVLRASAEKIVTPTCGPHGFYTLLGVYGHDKVDTGSAYLAAHIPDDIAGVGADFGCGYGYLTWTILQKNPSIKKLYAVDADARALSCIRAQAAVDTFGTVIPVWADLAILGDFPENLDFIVMNPPFHRGADTVPDLGKRMIERARSHLVPGGRLMMVANIHLPYEEVLRGLFRDVRCVTQSDGFKVFIATA